MALKACLPLLSPVLLSRSSLPLLSPGLVSRSSLQSHFVILSLCSSVQCPASVCYVSVYVSALCCTTVCVCVCVCGPRSLSASFCAYFDFPAPYSLLLTADCKTACSANAKCLGFVWNAAGCEGTPPPGNCYLKGKLEDKTAEGCSCSAIKPFPPPAPAPPGTMTSQLYGGMFHAFQSYRHMYLGTREIEETFSATKHA